jgi:hypothetical protein
MAFSLTHGGFRHNTRDDTQDDNHHNDGNDHREDNQSRTMPVAMLRAGFHASTACGKDLLLGLLASLSRLYSAASGRQLEPSTTFYSK